MEPFSVVMVRLLLLTFFCMSLYILSFFSMKVWLLTKKNIGVNLKPQLFTIFIMHIHIFEAEETHLLYKVVERRNFRF